MSPGDPEVTPQVETGGPDDDAVPLRRCLCGATYQFWDVTLWPYRDRAAPMPCCGARLYAAVAVRVYQVPEEPAP